MATPPPLRRIVIVAFGSLGDLYPFIALALQLRDLGFDPIIASSASHGPQVLSEGLRFHAVRPDEPDLVQAIKTDREGFVRMVTARPEFLIDRVVLHFLREALDDLMEVMPGAALAVFGMFSYAARMAAELCGVPCVTVALQPAAFNSTYDPPVGLGLPLLAAPLNPLALWVNRLIHPLWKKAMRAWAPQVDNLRAERGLPRMKMNPLLEGQMEAKVSIGLYPSVMGKVQPDFPRNAHIVGFAQYDRNAAVAAPLPPELEKFLASGPPPLVFTLGSFAAYNPGDFYEESKRAARQLGMRSVLVGRAADAAQEGGDFIACGYASYSALFPWAAAIVHHAGIGTLGQALVSGRPQLSVPVLQDQPDNAWRLQRLGVGKVIPRGRYARKTAVRALKAILASETIVRRAEEVAVSVRSEDGAAAAARIIGELCRRAG